MATYHVQFANGDNTEIETDKPLLIDEWTVRTDTDGISFWCRVDKVLFIKKMAGKPNAITGAKP